MRPERVSVLDLLCYRTGLPHDWVHEPGDRGLADDVGRPFNTATFVTLVRGLAFIRAGRTDRLGMTVGVSLDDLETSEEPGRRYMVREDTWLPALRLAIRTTRRDGIWAKGNWMPNAFCRRG